MTSVGTFTLAAALAVALSWLACRLPGPRALPMPERWHRTPTPVTGGIALFAAFALAVQPALHTGAIASWYRPGSVDSMLATSASSCATYPENSCPSVSGTASWRCVRPIFTMSAMTNGTMPIDSAARGPERIASHAHPPA